MEKNPTLMSKGISELRKTSSPQQTLLWTRPVSEKIHPSKAFHAVRLYYEKQAEQQRKTSSVSSDFSDSAVLQSCFLKRPGCPQYCHQATSASLAESSILKSGDLPSNLSTMSLTSQISLEDWNSLIQNPEVWDSRSRIRFCHSLSSEVVLPKWKSFTEGIVPPSNIKIRSGNKMPWYIPVLHEKDVSLNKMGEELARLAPYEAECTRKDAVIAVLREEVEAMQKQLEQLQKWQATFLGSTSIEAAEWGFSQLLGTSSLLQPEWKSTPSLRLDLADESSQEFERLKALLSQSEQKLDSKALILKKELLKDQEELEQMEKESLVELEDDNLSSSDSKLGEGESSDREESESTLILYKLLEFQKVNELLYEELQKARNEYELATGAISSLQRQLSFEESQLRKAHVDQESLQKELRERGEQLEAMSNKFCNLREERKHKEMMGSIERDNCELRQEVTKLEAQLADRDQTIHSLQSNVQQLQSELLVNQQRSGKQLSSQNELQKQLEILQRAEQQTRVTLESVSARFERFRSKIIQAAYSTPGTKSPQAEITDEEVLEALQKIITDRLDFHQMLKQKGVKVPSLSSEPAPPTTHKKKAGGK
ncbi:coiled-coil domain-containing protein 27 [Protobothrops mucrosquamatus]|uniref:coiled-coil domain-containing protein 27 n=1 Tax=Protobothrops mucrosquamatus TaxID=103944 RepID=UPI0010FBAA44|nr:coiled-coil domain-containing protein 27 [Protobothrops mucrosquamatus]